MLIEDPPEESAASVEPTATMRDAIVELSLSVASLSARVSDLEVQVTELRMRP